jgi:hypothetical protein
LTHDERKREGKRRRKEVRGINQKRETELRKLRKSGKERRKKRKEIKRKGEHVQRHISMIYRNQGAANIETRKYCKGLKKVVFKI